MDMFQKLKLFTDISSATLKRPPLPNLNPPRYTEDVIFTEEKGSDVNLALHFLDDAWLDNYDCGVIISNDSDLAEAVRLVKVRHNKIIGIINPQVKARPTINSSISMPHLPEELENQFKDFSTPRSNPRKDDIKT